MQVQLIRHATVVIEVAGFKLLVDPMFSPAGALDPVQNAENERRNPLVDLPVDVNQFVAPDAIVVTHTHRDHFDAEAVKRLDKDCPLFCQPPDTEKIRSSGFTNVIEIASSTSWNGLHLTRTTGHHGRGDIGALMGPVSGFVLTAPDEPTLYIAGDTIWCEEVQTVIDQTKPDTILVFAGGAQFLTGGPITMSTEDIEQLCLSAPDSRIIVAHMEAWNHCLLTREALRAFVAHKGWSERVWIPEDGAVMKLD